MFAGSSSMWQYGGRQKPVLCGQLHIAGAKLYICQSSASEQNSLTLSHTVVYLLQQGTCGEAP